MHKKFFVLCAIYTNRQLYLKINTIYIFVNFQFIILTICSFLHFAIHICILQKYCICKIFVVNLHNKRSIKNLQIVHILIVNLYSSKFYILLKICSYFRDSWQLTKNLQFVQNLFTNTLSTPLPVAHLGDLIVRGRLRCS